jgi:hypothetical protein
VETVAQQRQHRVGVRQVGHVLGVSWPKPPSSVAGQCRVQWRHFEFVAILPVVPSCHWKWSE